MKLEQLFQDFLILKRTNWKNRDVKRVTADSRGVEAGDLFIANPGVRMNGHDFLNQAIVAGATAIVYEHLPEELNIPQHIVGIQVRNSQEALAKLLLRIHDNPD